MSRLTEILEGLSELSLDELEQVRTAIIRLKSVTGNSFKASDDKSLLVLDVIQSTLSGLGIEYCHVSALQKSQGYPAFKAKIPELMQYLQPVTASRMDLRAILQLAIELLYTDLVAMDIPVSSRLLMGHVHRIPSVLNKHFPGYAASGLLRMIIRRT